MNWLLRYFYEIKLSKAILWCYLIWYLVTVYFYFDPSLKLWMNAIGISAVIGTGLILSVSHSSTNAKNNWQVFRLYLMPFCVSSFSALIKGQEFIVFVSPKLHETIVSVIICALFMIFVFAIKSVKL